MKLFCLLCFAILLAICSEGLARPDPESKETAKKLKGEKALKRNKWGRANFPEELDVTESDPSGKELKKVKLRKVVSPKVELLLRRVNQKKEIATYISDEASLACVLDSETDECHLMGYKVDGTQACMVVDGIETCEPRTAPGTTFDLVLDENGEPLTDEAIVERRQERRARDTSGKNRRSATGHHNIELCVAMDYEWYRKTIRVHPADSTLTDLEFAELMAILIINSVHQIYSVISDRDFTLGVVLADLHIATTNEESSWTILDKRGKANAAKMWKHVDSFMESAFEPSKCDGYMAVTGHELVYSGQSTILGIAYMGSICNSLNRKKQASPVSFTAFGFETFYTLAHELAHTLGVGHDPSGACSQPETVMAAVAADPVPGWYDWSSCAKDDFDDFLSTNHACLDSDSFDPSLHASNLCEGFVGEYLDVNDQCQWNYEIDGFRTGYDPVTLGETICSTFTYCSSRYDDLLVDDYTPCGVGGADKICFQGSCVDNTLPSCP